MHEIKRPPLVGRMRRCDCTTADVAYLALLARTYLQVEAAIDPSKAILPDRRLLASQQNQQPPPTPTRSPLGKFL